MSEVPLYKCQAAESDVIVVSIFIRAACAVRFNCCAGILTAITRVVKFQHIATCRTHQYKHALTNGSYDVRSGVGAPPGNVVNPSDVPLSATEVKREALKNLRRRTQTDEIVIKSANKGSATVIMSREDYVTEAMRQLNREEHYHRLDQDPTPEYTTQIIQLLGEMRDCQSRTCM